ncbi:MAG TPA: DUF6603 domain-containing protein, partial [Magnetospirillum sp.]|nr:DUF6603 domain-containing protein [Magnetospirillum sp.]
MMDGSSFDSVTDTPAIVIEGASLDPVVLALARAGGLLVPTASGSDLYELSAAWFADPIGHVGTAFKTNGPELATLIAQLLGKLGGNSLGIPVKNPGCLGEWMPINNPATGAATGLYVVSYPELDASGAVVDQVFGLGAMYDRTFSASGVAATGPQGIEVALWGLIPLVKVGDGELDVTLGGRGYPLQMGIAVSGADGKPIIDADGLSFSGAKVTATIDPAAPSVDLSVVVLQLKLPTDTQASDRNLADLAAITPMELVSTIATMAVIAVTDAFEAAAKQAPFLLTTIGLSPVVPNSQTRLPLLRWDSVVALAVSGGNPAQPFMAWFAQVLADPTLTSTWLGCITGLMGGTPSQVGGAGTRADPFTLPLLTLPSVGTLSFTASTTVDATGLRVFRPGLAVAAKPAPLGSVALLKFGADLELATFALAPDAPHVAAEVTFAAGLALTSQSKGKPLFSGQVNKATYSFGSLQAGITLVTDGGSPAIVPSFQLVEVETPEGSFASLDLLQPGTVVKQAIATVYALIQDAFQSLFGTEAATFGGLLSALVGASKPDCGAQTWPAALVPPFTAEGLPDAYQNPVAALGAYYAKALFGGQMVGDKPAFTYVVQSFANLLAQAGAGAATVTGTGTKDDPWLAPLGAANSPVDLMAYVLPASQSSGTLVLGLALAPTLDIAGGPAMTALVSLDLLALDIAPDGQSLAGARVLPSLGASFLLPQGYVTPPVAGASLSVGETGFSTRWTRGDGWAWNMRVGQPAVVVDGTPMPVGTDMEFSDATGLENLVTQASATFAPLLTRLLGVAAYRSGTRAGLALNGVVGLLPNLADQMPPGMAWPASMPVLAPTGFSDPLGDFKAQLAGVFSSDANAKAALALLGWATGSGTDAPAIDGAGTFLDPYRVPLGLPLPFDAGVWIDPAAATVGVGLARSIATAFTGIGCTVTLAANLREFALGANLREFALGADSPPSRPLLPGAALTATFTGADGGALIEGPTLGKLGAVTVGCQLGWVDGAVCVTPVFTLTDVALTGYPSVAQLALPPVGAPANVMDAFTAQLNMGLSAAIGLLAENPTFQTVTGILTALGLYQGGDTPGLNAGGFTALIANPTGFLTQGLLNVLCDTGTRSEIFGLISRLTGIDLPQAPAGLLALGQALGLLTGAEQGYAPIPSAWISLLANPAVSLPAMMDALWQDAAARTALTGALTANLDGTAFGPFKISIANGTRISVDIPAEAPVLVGGIVAVTGAASFDVVTGKVATALDLTLTPVGLGLRPALTVDAAAGSAALSASLVFGGDGMPAPAPLQFWPFDAETFVSELSVVAPAYALGTFVTGVVEPLLLNRYPLSQAIFTALGLAWHDDATQAWHLKSPLGLFQDPLGWLLSDAVVGAGGQLNIAQIAKTLAAIPAAGQPGGVTVAQVPGGVRIAGLPYNLAVDFLANTQTGLFSVAPRILAPIPLADDLATLSTLSFALSLNPSFQPGFVADVALAGMVAGNPLAVATGYDRQFRLSLGMGTGKPTFDILPFPGWQTLIQTALQMAVPKLVAELADVLLTGLAKNGAADIATRLRTAGAGLQVAALVEDLAVVTDPDQVPQTALKWLGQRLATENAAATVGAVVTLLDGLIEGVSAKDALVFYTPSDTLPVTIVAGLDTKQTPPQLGLWADLAPPSLPLVNISLRRTGISLPFAADGTPLGENPVFRMGVSLGVPIEGDQGPTLSIDFESDGPCFTVSVDPMGGGDQPSSLARELLPRPFGQTTSDAISRAAEEWAVAVLTQVVPRYVSLVVLNADTVAQWLNTPLFAANAGPAPGPILVGAHLLTKTEAKKYILTSFDELQKLSIQDFLGGLLRTMLETRIRLLPLNKTGGIWIGPQPGAPGNYGVTVAVPDLVVKKTAPKLVVQLGAADKDWIAGTGLPTDLEPGIGVFVPVTDDGPHFDKLKLALVNVGIDLAGTQSAPLVNQPRFKMQAVAPRGLLTLDFADPKVVTGFGGALGLEQMAPSLVPNASSSGGGNPVAQNLLGSGDPDSEAKNNPPANPAFSAQAAYGYRLDHGSGNLWVQLYGADGKPAKQVVIPVQRSFGPLHVDSVGFGWEQADKIASVLFDGSVQLAGLGLEVDGLSVGMPVTDPTNFNAYRLDLRGLDVSFKGGSVQIEGGLLKCLDPQLAYNGQLVVKASSFSLVALGSYAELPTEGGTAPSLFAFLNLNAPLGGPPEFFIEGLAFGFGYNRDITIPPVGEIQQFPLVQGAIQPSTFGPDPSPESALRVLSSVVAPEIGRYWVAAGLKFSNYKLLSTFALLFVKFGRSFEIDLVGVTSASLPPMVPPSSALAYVELGLVVSFKPDEGVFLAAAQLTPNSFLFSSSCKLTGGFAAYLWYAPPPSADGPQAGDFVITLGGYNPVFSPAKWYPTVPRLGFNWPVTDQIGIRGGCYFALTPSAVMAGGNLAVLFQAGPLRAWLNAGANVLIAWDPFWFDAGIYVDVGVSFHTELLGISVTLSVSLGCKLHLMGPPVHGSVEVNWFIISFSIPIGSGGSAAPPTLDWDQFALKFLPPAKAAPQAAGRLAAQAAAAPVTATAASGMLTTLADGTWVLQSLPFAIQLATAIPATSSTLSGWQGGALPQGPAMGVQPCSAMNVTTPFTVTITDAGGTVCALPPDSFGVTATMGSAAGALWANRPFDP